MNNNYIQLVEDIPYNFVCQRCGVIPYCTINNMLLFALAMDSKSGQLTDFGGFTTIREYPIYAALREFNEESLNAFGYINPATINEQIVIHDNYHLIIFLHVEVNPTIIDKRFKKMWHYKHKEKQYLENCGIFWCNQEQLCRMLKINIIYKPVTTLLKNIKQIINLL